jgi:hypothetical protein
MDTFADTLSSVFVSKNLGLITIKKQQKLYKNLYKNHYTKKDLYKNYYTKNLYRTYTRTLYARTYTKPIQEPNFLKSPIETSIKKHKNQTRYQGLRQISDKRISKMVIELNIQDERQR